MKKMVAFAIAAITAGGTLSAQVTAADLSPAAIQGQVKVILANGGNQEELQKLCEKLGISLEDIRNGKCPIFKFPANTPGLPGGGTDLPDFELPDWKPPTGDKPVLPDEKPENPGDKPSLPDWKPPTGDKPSLPDEKPENPGDKPVLPDEKPNTSFVNQVAALVNQEREKAGLAPLSLNTTISSAAQVRAKEIVSQFSHTRPDGRDFSTALQEKGISYKGSGENIAKGQKTPEQVMQGWMNSSGHRANILGNYTNIGVGYYEINGVTYWTQLFTR